MQELAKRFVPAADEVGYLQSQRGPECELFRAIAEQGHYAGRTQPTNTRQGIYAAAPNGILLASINTRSPREMAAMLRRALVKWEGLLTEERLFASDPRERPEGRRRLEELYPEGGLVLRQVSRDLPRKGEAQPTDWRSEAFNLDFAWFRKEEARAMLPETIEAGQRHAVPAPLVRRLARLHLVDNVRGQTIPYDEKQVQEAVLSVEILAVDGAMVTLRLEGRSRTLAEGLWAVEGTGRPVQTARGYDATLSGSARFDAAAGRFVEFELVAEGLRHGATQYNCRSDDPGPAPMGVVFTLADPTERVAPAFAWGYDWRPTR
ncbi:MAG: hypothetical protein ACT4PV_14475 [Planctomycetaceae bacterium]